ncbi:pentapeptide repeat-containing protein [Micromonospora sp. NPDC005215]|uniref:pentapeptide repeat-containing protein n=1 Tax=Micromonospora sp. NPDC005215 TaxID=3157024 RepID=UPI00339F709E
MELPAENLSPSPSAAVSVPAVSAASSPVPALKLWEIRRSIGLSIGAALLMVVGLIACALWYGGFPSLAKDSTVTTRTLFDLLKLVFAVVAGIGGVAALVVAYRRQRVAEHGNKLAEFAHELAHAADARAEVTKALAEAADERAKIEADRNGMRLFNERFAKASEQLGSEKAAVRLAGVYAMAGLADDWMEGRQTCIDVLCAYLRMPYDAPREWAGDGLTSEEDGRSEKIDQRARSAREEREVRHSAFRLIGRHLRLQADDANSWRGYDYDFTGAVLDGGDFSGATFDGGMVSFREAMFTGGTVSFTGATFSGGRVSFRGAMFIGGTVSFTGATFSGGRVSFGGATFSDGTVTFGEATFSGGRVSFGEAMFSGASVFFGGARYGLVKISGGTLTFGEAMFSGGSVSFAGMTLSGGTVTFSRATFSGGRVSFGMATFGGGDASFAGASLSGGTVTFAEATFSGGRVFFGGATFSGASVFFNRAIFVGGKVDFERARFGVPPEFDPGVSGRPPAGVLFPIG